MGVCADAGRNKDSGDPTEEQPHLLFEGLQVVAQLAKGLPVQVLHIKVVQTVQQGPPCTMNKRSR
jgi:hypothetical protein